MPHAIEWSFATPNTRAFFPASKPIGPPAHSMPHRRGFTLERRESGNTAASWGLSWSSGSALPRGSHMINRTLTAVVLVVMWAIALPGPTSADQAAAERSIVQLADGANLGEVLKDSDRARSVRPTHVFEHALHGF